MYTKPELVKKTADEIYKILSDLTAEDCAEVFLSIKTVVSEKVMKDAEEAEARTKSLKDFYNSHLKP